MFKLYSSTHMIYVLKREQKKVMQNSHLFYIYENQMRVFFLRFVLFLFFIIIVLIELLLSYGFLCMRLCVGVCVCVCVIIFATILVAFSHTDRYQHVKSLLH